jgi:hypothetical protein
MPGTIRPVRFLWSEVEAAWDCRNQREVLEEELRRVRLGPLHRPNATLRELTDVYVAQYDAAPSTRRERRDSNPRPPA